MPNSSNANYLVGHCGAFCGLDDGDFDGLKCISIFSRDCSDCFLSLLSVFLFSMPFKVITIFIEYFIEHKYV